MRHRIPDGVEVTPAILHAYYPMKRGTYDTRVRGISTAIIAGRFQSGEAMYAIANDYVSDKNRDEMFALVLQAIRWELLPRRTRVRLVAAEVSNLEAKLAPK